MPSYKVEIRNPTPSEYIKLRSSAGWDQLSHKAIQKGLAYSSFSVCIMHENQTIGCGRIVGDNAMYFYIQGIIVLPEFQGRGVGEVIMKKLLDYLNKYAHNNSFIGLMAAEGVKDFYHRYGFLERAPSKPGMYKIWKDSI